MSIKHVDTHIGKSTKRITTPLVSTLICTYNAEAFFTPTIKSVLAQTYIHQEILIRDDGSSDRTVQMLHDRAEQDDRITIFVDPGTKRGAYGGLNFLLDQAQGTYIAIQDHDDIWHPEKLEKQVTFLEKHIEYAGCGTRTVFYYEDTCDLCIGKMHTGRIDKVPHTSLVFRNTHNRYDLSHDILIDTIFMTHTLGDIYLLDPVLTLHRIRADGKNLGSAWFKNSNKLTGLLTSGHISLFSYLYTLYIGIFPRLSRCLSTYIFSRDQWIAKRGKKMATYLTYIADDRLDELLA